MAAVTTPAGVLRGKVDGGLREVGAMFAVALEALRLLFRRGLPFREFVDQCWFLARVTTLPLILVSIPFGAGHTAGTTHRHDTPTGAGHIADTTHRRHDTPARHPLR